MKNKVSSIVTRMTALALFAAPLCPMQLQAQEVYSQIVGAIAIDVPADSDVVVAFPFKRSASFRGPAASSTANTITITGPVFTAGEFDAVNGVSSYYVFIESDDASSGNLAGRRYDIISNTDSILTVDATEDISGFGGQAGDTISVREHWTLGEAFPSGVGFVEETEPGLPQVEVLLPVKTSVGEGLVTQAVFYFYNGAWRQYGEALTSDVGGTIIPPGSSFVISNNSTAEALRTYFFGEVVDAPLAIPVVSTVGDGVDNFVSIERPLGLTLDDLIGGAGLGLEDLLGTDDRLLVYGFGAGRNKTPTEYQYNGTQWQVAGSSTNAGSTEIKAGEGIAIRKAAGADAESFWVNEWDLPQ